MASRTLRHPTHVQANVTDEALEELEELLGRHLLENERTRIEAERARIVFERQRFDTENESFANEPEHAFQARGNRTNLDKNKVDVLQPGDHVAWHRSYAIWHHAIVVKIDRHRKKLLVIQWHKVNDGNSEWKIVEEWIDSVSQNGEFYRIDYEQEVTERNPTALVLYRARCEVGRTNYTFLNNNCETFATYCKTDIRDGCQKNWFRKNVKEAMIVSASRLASFGGKFVRELSRVTFVEVLTETGTVSLAETIEKLNRSTDVLGAAIVVALEGGFMIWDISRMYERRQDGRITRKDFIETATQRFCEALFGAGLAICGTIGGAALGGAVGGLLGSVVFIVGTATGASVGAFIGSIAGGALGSISGRALGSLVGPSAGRVITHYINRDDRAVSNISDICRGDQDSCDTKQLRTWGR